MTKTIDLHWSDVKRQLLASLDEGKPWRQAMHGYLSEMHRAPYKRNDWMGGSGADVLGWVRDGYFAPELAAAADRPVDVVTRPMWSEEDGDVDAGRLFGGYDDFYFAMGEREAKPGLTVRADMFFAAMCSATTLKDYGSWLAGLIGALEAQGTDLAVEIVLPVTLLYRNARPSERQEVRIRVKDFGELSDFTEWSACFSPASTRVIMFTAFGVASDKIGEQQTDHMSRSLATNERTWGADFDADENVLTITANQRQTGEHAFPAASMTAAVKDAGLI